MRLGNAWVKAISKMLSCSSSARPRGWSNARDLHGVPERGARKPARPAHALGGAGVWGDLLAAAVRGDSVADDQAERSAERYDGDAGGLAFGAGTESGRPPRRIRHHVRACRV